LGPYAAWFPGFDLSRDFEGVKVSGNSTQNLLCFGVFLRVKFSRSLFSRVDSRIMKTLAEWPEKSTKRHLSFADIIARRPQGRALQPFSVHIIPRISLFFL
jgi:hypothetical protein